MIKMHAKEKPNVLVIGNPHSHPSAKAFLIKFTNIIKAISNVVYIISGDKPPDYDNVSWIELMYYRRGSSFSRCIEFVKIQIKLLWMIAKMKRYYDVVVILPTAFVFPTVFLRLTRKKVGVFVAQKPSNPVLELLCCLNFKISNLIIIESSNVIKDWRIDKYEDKIIKGSIYVDTNFFRKEKEIWERKEVVGYIGNLEERKGINELLKAISLLNSASKYNIGFKIGGTGNLENITKSFATRTENTTYIGFVQDEYLPKFYNELKLFILPSYSEGLPNVILEAMACGTPVLATAVGAIPDVIKNGKTGFIMENNSPACIAENIIKALKHPNLNIIVKNANELTKKEFTYEAAVKRYTRIILQLST